VTPRSWRALPKRSLAPARALDVYLRVLNRPKTTCASLSTSRSAMIPAPSGPCRDTLEARITIQRATPEVSASILYPQPCRVRRKRGRLPSNVSIRSDPAVQIPPRPDFFAPGHSRWSHTVDQALFTGSPFGIASVIVAQARQAI
jgi:hypothetical protein